MGAILFFLQVKLNMNDSDRAVLVFIMGACTIITNV